MFVDVTIRAYTHIDVYSAFAVIFNILCLQVAYDSMRLCHWYLHYIYDLILYLCIMCYTVCYLTGIFYAVVRQISMLFIDNKISVFCILNVYVADATLSNRRGSQERIGRPEALAGLNFPSPGAARKVRI